MKIQECTGVHRSASKRARNKRIRNKRRRGQKNSVGNTTRQCSKHRKGVKKRNGNPYGNNQKKQ